MGLSVLHSTSPTFRYLQSQARYPSGIVATLTTVGVLPTEGCWDSPHSFAGISRICYGPSMSRSQTPELHVRLLRNVRAIREDKGWSQTRLAEEASRLGLPWNRATVSDLELDPPRRNLTAAELTLLPAVLGVELSDLLGKGSVRIGSAEVSSRTVLRLLGGQASRVRERDIRLKARGRR